MSLILAVAGMIMINIVSDKATELYNMHVLGIEELSNVQNSYELLRININKITIAALSGDIDGLNAQKDDLNKNKNNLDIYLLVS